ncbi:hypothetical protein [Actinokineospora sp. NBRC 105648]|uniref:hypothetical protein n=1 Tax=Actinokineospora sp. NBRC 105648 TaxID=3032206 RepID=UPI0024A5B212|nr:hypothetical protein [Actinokineospora sp. NBRC 105648]GLZ41754.1 hypothetical protein Acsp05_53780 [Actinokineospora sp. NBRC 105648]
MTSAPSTDLVHQLVWGRPENGPPTTRASAGFEASAVRWQELLTRYVRIAPVRVDGVQWAPAEAFSYLEFGDQGALVRRSASPVTGWTSCHCLIGSVAALRPLSVGLTTWAGWLTGAPTGVLMPLSAKSLLDECHLLGKLVRAEVEALVQVLLAEPTALVSVVAAESDPVRLVAAARAALDPRPVPWTYSTYQHTDTSPEGAAPPQIVFLPSLPVSGATLRRRVSTATVREHSEAARLAHNLAERYLSSLDDSPAPVEVRLGAEAAAVADRIRVALAEQPRPEPVRAPAVVREPVQISEPTPTFAIVLAALAALTFLITLIAVVV